MPFVQIQTVKCPLSGSNSSWSVWNRIRSTPTKKDPGIMTTRTLTVCGMYQPGRTCPRTPRRHPQRSCHSGPASPRPSRWPGGSHQPSGKNCMKFVANKIFYFHGTVQILSSIRKPTEFCASQKQYIKSAFVSSGSGSSQDFCGSGFPKNSLVELFTLQKYEVYILTATVPVQDGAIGLYFG